MTTAHEARSRGRQRGWTASRDQEGGFGQEPATLYPDSELLQAEFRAGFREGWENYVNGLWSDGVPRARYFVTQPCSCPDSPVEHEVSKADYVRAERRAGFNNTLGQPDEPATGSFSLYQGGVSISGRIEHEPFTELLSEGRSA